MRITSIQNLSTKSISFGNRDLNNITPTVGLLSLQNSDKLNFEKNLRLAQKADAVQSNPIKALANKFVKAYNILFSEKHEARRQSAPYVHIPYLA